MYTHLYDLVSKLFTDTFTTIAHGPVPYSQHALTPIQGIGAPQAQPGRRGRGEKCRHRHTHIAQLLYTFRTYHEALPCCRLLQIYGSMQ